MDNPEKLATLGTHKYTLLVLNMGADTFHISMFVRGHNTGLISKHPFHDTFINQYTNV